MKALQFAKRGAATVAVVVCGVIGGVVAQEKLAAFNAPTPREEWGKLAQEHSDSSYDAAMKRFGGRVTSRLQTALQALPLDHTVLAVVTAADLRGCEDLGRQLRELSKAVPSEPGWGLAILVDAAGSEDLRRFLERERVPPVPILVGHPTAFLEGGEHPGTPAAAVVVRDGRIAAGISHPLRVRNTRSRSFAQELGLSGIAGTDLIIAGARGPR
ncbi:MAG TPA: hypothetical protein VGC13_14495 [Longimicrobium sp.]|jgi:hypothetical protein|uniref:hypothetical protein n=1 Tax=Longimicrobium sp. TaxID=2029185 RepID=UPI002ED7AE0A